MAINCFRKALHRGHLKGFSVCLGLGICIMPGFWVYRVRNINFVLNITGPYLCFLFWIYWVSKYTKVLNMPGYIMEIIHGYTRHFRPKLVHWNEDVHCMPINRALKSFLRPTIPELWRILWNQLHHVLVKINTQI